jgi:deoxyribose-phosphate aldolase
VSEGLPRALDPALLRALEARARGEADFVAQIATVQRENWDAALDAYRTCFEAAAKALLERARLARDRRNTRP